MKIEINITFTPERIRQVAAKVRRDDGGFTTAQSEAFLSIYENRLKNCMENAATDFIKNKLR